MEATVRHIGDMTFLGIPSSGHAVLMDTSIQNGGNNSAASPMEHVLMALGTCSAIDVVSILDKKRIDVKDFAVRLNGVRRDEYPRIFTSIELDYVFKGSNLEEKRKHLEDAVRLSQEKYCSVAGMLAATVQLTWKVSIESI